jgi:hypothetical protein
MNKTLEETTVKRYYCQSHKHLKQHPHSFSMAYNFPKRLKALKGLAPYECLFDIWQKEPERFAVNPLLHTLGLNT